MTGARNSYDEDGRLITANNGPFGGNDREINRTGFYVRKYLDATPSAGTIGRGSEMRNVYFRNRAGISSLNTIDHEKIMHEYRVEFAFEGNRWWDLKRWMEASKIWTGEPTARTSQRLGLWPFKVVASGDPNDGKWVFIEKDMQKLDLWRRPLKCTEAQYYSEIDNGWINNNPKLVKNPYQ